MDHVLAGIVKDRTVVLVTHNKTSLSFCDRIFLMEHGRLQEIAKDSLLDRELDAAILDDTKFSNSNVNDNQTRLSFSSERSDSIEDLEPQDGREFDVLGGAAAVTEGVGHREMAENGSIPENASKEPVSENVQIVGSGELDQKRTATPSSANGKEMPVRKGNSDVNKGGQLTVKEDRVEGEVTWATYFQYAKDSGG